MFFYPARSNPLLMKIVDYELYTIPPRWLFLKLETDTGVVGWGEPVIEGRVNTVKQFVSELVEDHLIGEDPRNIERHWQHFYHGSHHRGGPMLMSSIAGIDHALWDINGKISDKPVYELLGGAIRDKVQICQWVTGDKSWEIAESAAEAVEEGYTAIEMMMNVRPSTIQASDVLNTAEQRLMEVRDIAGPNVDIAVDFRGRTSRAVAKQLLSLVEQYEVMYVEEPLLPENNDSLSELAKNTNVPFATGQRMYSRWDFKQILTEGVIDVAQPSICHAGGITEMRKIANMAEAFDTPVVSKCPVGPIAFAAGIHLCLATQNIIMQDQHHEVYAEKGSNFLDYVANPGFFEHENGYVAISDEPGLGIAIDESAVESKSDRDLQWQSPVWHYDDGSVADW
jgi:galactonate dehydratase